MAPSAPALFSTTTGYVVHARTRALERVRRYSHARTHTQMRARGRAGGWSRRVGVGARACCSPRAGALSQLELDPITTKPKTAIKQEAYILSDLKNVVPY